MSAGPPPGVGGPPPGVGGPPPGVDGPPPGAGGPPPGVVIPSGPPRTELTAPERQLTERMVAFGEDARARVLGRIEQLNGGLSLEQRSFTYDNGEHHVEVTRGSVVEKAGWYVNVPTKGQPPFVPDPLWGRYVEVNVHPASPHVGLLHATVYLSYFTNGMSTMSGYLDYTPAVWHEEDNERLKTALDAVYDRHGADITRFRAQLGDSEFGKTHHREGLRAACVGVSLYDPPMMSVDADSFALATDGFDAFVGTYLDIVAERADQPFTDADVAEQDAMRKRWLEDQLFADTMSMKVVPYEVWSMANQAPTIKF